jgi:hypothetical protein
MMTGGTTHWQNKNTLKNRSLTKLWLKRTSIKYFKKCSTLFNNKHSFYCQR